MKYNELTYWMALTHLPTIWTKRKNEFIVICFNNKLSIIDLFENESLWNDLFNMGDSEKLLFKEQKKKLPNYSFLAENLLEQGYNIIPITSKEYSPLLKKNLKTSSPTVLYTKGNLQLLQEDSVAIVGSRNAEDISLEFTDNIAQKVSKQYKVVVSGFAKGIDRKALDSTLFYKGQSIIVLPQGITTFDNGFKQYYKYIVEGDVLVLSTFESQLQWSIWAAMQRNTIIYGLAKEIYVAQSDKKGGTWEGVQNGLKKGRTIYVRKAEQTEKNANNLLINQGVIPVDIYGNILQITKEENNEDIILNKIIELLKDGKAYSSKEIIEKLQLKDWKTVAMTKYLQQKEEFTKIINSKPKKFKLKSITTNTSSLF